MSLTVHKSSNFQESLTPSCYVFGLQRYCRVSSAKWLKLVGHMAWDRQVSHMDRLVYMVLTMLTIQAKNHNQLLLCPLKHNQFLFSIHCTFNTLLLNVSIKTLTVTWPWTYQLTVCLLNHSKADSLVNEIVTYFMITKMRLHFISLLHKNKPHQMVWNANTV